MTESVALAHRCGVGKKLSNQATTAARGQRERAILEGQEEGRWQKRQEVAVMDLTRQMDTAEINDVAFWPRRLFSMEMIPGIFERMNESLVCGGVKRWGGGGREGGTGKGGGGES